MAYMDDESALRRQRAQANGIADKEQMLQTDANGHKQAMNACEEPQQRNATKVLKNSWIVSASRQDESLTSELGTVQSENERLKRELQVLSVDRAKLIAEYDQFRMDCDVKAQLLGDMNFCSSNSTLLANVRVDGWEFIRQFSVSYVSALSEKVVERFCEKRNQSLLAQCASLASELNEALRQNNEISRQHNEEKRRWLKERRTLLDTLTSWWEKLPQGSKGARELAEIQRVFDGCNQSLRLVSPDMMEHQAMADGIEQRVRDRIAETYEHRLHSASNSAIECPRSTLASTPVIRTLSQVASTPVLNPVPRTPPIASPNVVGTTPSIGRQQSTPVLSCVSYGGQKFYRARSPFREGLEVARSTTSITSANCSSDNRSVASSVTTTVKSISPQHQRPSVVIRYPSPSSRSTATGSSAMGSSGQVNPSSINIIKYQPIPRTASQPIPRSASRTRE